MSLIRKSIVCSQILLCLLVSVVAVWADGEIDPASNIAPFRNASYSAEPAIKVQPDGKLLIGFFDFGVNNGIAAKGIARLNTDGTVDASFHAPTLTAGNVQSFGLQSNGKILIRGSFSIANSPYRNLARLNIDGSLDTTFNVNTPPLPHEGYEIFVQPDDSFFTGSTYKFDANGFRDNSFDYEPFFFGRVTNIVGLPDGKVYIGGQVPMSSGFDYLDRHNADGSPDDSFAGIQPNDHISKMIVQPDGKLLISGPFTFVNSTPVVGIARLNTDGSVDSTFNPGGSGANVVFGAMELLPDGKILIGGSFDSYNGVTRRRIARLNSDGTLDTSFNYSGIFNNVFIGRLAVRPDGKIIVGGSVRSTTQLRASLIMLNADGFQDTEFFVMKAISQRVRKAAVQSDGKILIAGNFSRVNGYERNFLARLEANGVVDSTFEPYFNSSPGQEIHQILVQPDGKILLSFSNGAVVARINSNGSRDSSFSNPFPTSAVIYDLALQSDGKVLVAGENSFGGPPIFARLNTNGSLDTSFNPPVPNDAVYRVLIQPDGKSIICGEFTQISGSSYGRLARYNTDGTLDNTFNPAGGADGNVYDIDLQTDGKIVLVGTFGLLNGSSQSDKVGRLNPDGSLDTSFAQTIDTIVQTVKVQPDGKVLIGGIFTTVGGTPREKLARLNSNGSVDTTFNASADALVFDINLQSDGNILVVGDFVTVNNVTKLGVATLKNSALLRNLFDFDGDGRDDISVFRPAENKWYISRSSDGQITQEIFAVSGDIAAPADYDGDGKTDIGIFRPSNGNWWYLSSIDGGQKNFQWGATGDVPRPSDFDGDGKDDFVIYRAAENNWYRFGSTAGVSIVNFGSAGDKPLIGDFDGDGKSDPAIYRPSTGTWWYRSSINDAQIATGFGVSTDIPVPADYDGDGKTDLAVYRPSTGAWYILNSSTGQATIVGFGLSGDKPVAADYDGDGKADIAVFRPSTGIWYLLRSTQGFAALQFGVSTDIPTPNSFIP